jgi:hypothetical protein
MFQGWAHGIDIYAWIWFVVWFISRWVKSPKVLKPAIGYDSKRVLFLFTCLALTWTGVLTGLSILWYSQTADGGFHWFDDNAGWLQVDKLGHFFTTFQESRLIMLMVSWTGINSKAAAKWGFFGGLLFQTPIELLDGFQPTYGASWGDLLANFSGAVLFYVQITWMHKLILIPKFSVSAHPLAELRPGFFGNNFFQKILKDYNGQTYWMSIEIPFLHRRLGVPDWLCVSIGYSGEGLLGGDDNIFKDKTGEEKDYSHILRSRQWLLSLDVNWEKVNAKSYWLKTAIQIVSLIKFPAPALEYNAAYGLRWHWVYF